MIKRLFHFIAALSMAAAGMISAVQATVVSFGSGSNVFQMEFVTIGNPGNAADRTGEPNPAGAVGYTYGIGKFEVSNDMITKYNNLNPSLQINKIEIGANKPAIWISWNEAARFVNWLSTSTGGFAAYKFTTGGVNDNIDLWNASDRLDYDPCNPYRSKRASYVLPSYNEWYKAAYYNPHDRTYYDFPTGSNTIPTSVTGGTDANTAVYRQNGVGPADVDKAGGLSPYGVMGLGGNAYEWEESSSNLANSSGSSARGIRGGSWGNRSRFLSSSVRSINGPDVKLPVNGFRVATNGGSGGGCEVPEPTTIAIFGLGALGMAFHSRRRNKSERL